MYPLIEDGPYFGKDFFNFSHTSTLPRHRWYYFKEGFSSRLVSEAVSCTPKKKKALSILDPFGGSGTTIVSALQSGHTATSIEVNPFLAFTARVKSTTGTWRRTLYTERLDKVIKTGEIGRASPLEKFSTFTSQVGAEKWLFNSSVLRCFEGFWQAIERYALAYEDPLKLALIAAAFDCSNAKRDGKALRYKKDWKERKFSGADLSERFKIRALTMLEDSERVPLSTTGRVVNADSRSVQLEERYDLLVTSPPYLNSFDYSDVYRPELFLGKFVEDNGDLRRLRLKTLRSHVQVKWDQSITFESEILKPYVKELEQKEDLWNQRLPVMLSAYFDDLFKVFVRARSHLRKGAEAWIVVSTSAYAGKVIPVDLILADACSHAGFNLKAIHCLRHLRAAGQQWSQLDTPSLPLRESLIILQRD